MEIDLLLTSWATIGLIIYALIKWVKKGDIFHPAFLYSVINGGMFAFFAFGFYNFKYEINPSYYYIYISNIYVFVVSVLWGIKNGKRHLLKDIKLKPAQLSAVYLLSVCLGLFVVVPLIVVTGGSIDQAVTNRFETFAEGAEAVATNSTNPSLFFLNVLIISLRQITGGIVISYCLIENKKYQRAMVLLLLMVLEAIYTNSRTGLLFGLAIFIVPAYIKFFKSGFLELRKIQWQKYKKYFLAIGLATILILGFLTNIRSSVMNADSEIPYEAIERLVNAERKPWFDSLSQILPLSVMNPLVVLSLYSGSAIAIGGAVTNIALNENLNTCGIRSLGFLYRVIDRLGLAPELVNQAQENLNKIWEMGGPAFVYGWWGAPANYIVDFGLIGGFLAAAIIGWIIGWIYGRISNSGFVVKATVSFILFNAMLLTPAINPFGFFPSFISLVLIIIYILNNTCKPSPSGFVDSYKLK